MEPTPENTEKTPELIKEVIDAKAIVDIPLGTGFYMRLKQLAGFLLKGKTLKEIEEAHQMLLKQQLVEGSWQYHLATLTVLINRFEKEVKEKGLSREMTQEEFEQITS